MAKSARSNRKKALRSVRREKVVNQTKWVAEAERKRQETLAKCMAADPIPVPEPPQDAARMEVQKPSRPTEVTMKQADAPETHKKNKRGPKRGVKIRRGINKKVNPANLVWGTGKPMRKRKR